MILHICELKSVFFKSRKRIKKMILHTYGLTSDFFLHISATTITIRNRVRQNHIILQLKLKKQLVYNYMQLSLKYYNYCAIIPLEIQCINKYIVMSKN
jgi:hypothetical protein